MELFLNLLWLCISLVALACWIFSRKGNRPFSSRPRRATFLLEFGALTCVLIFLFFAISVTDNLHPEIFGAVEDGSVSRRALGPGNHQAAPLNSHHVAVPPANFVQRDILSLYRVALYLISPHDLPIHAATFVATFEGRAPPAPSF